MRSFIIALAFAAVALASPVPQPEELKDITIGGEIELGTAVPDVVVYGKSEDVQVTHYKQPVQGKIIVSGGGSGKNGKWGGNIHVGGEIRFSRTPEQEAAELASVSETEQPEGYGIKIEGSVGREDGKWKGDVKIGGSISFSNSEALEEAAASYMEPLKGSIIIKGGRHCKGHKWHGDVVVGGQINFLAPAEEVARYSLNGEEMVFYKQPVDGKIIVSGGASGKGGKWDGNIGIRGEIHFSRSAAEVEEEAKTGVEHTDSYKLRLKHGSIKIGGSISFNAPEPQVQESLAYKRKWHGKIHVGGSIGF